MDSDVVVLFTLIIQRSGFLLFGFPRVRTLTGSGVNRACEEREFEVFFFGASETVAALSASRSGEMRGVCVR